MNIKEQLDFLKQRFSSGPSTFIPKKTLDDIFQKDTSTVSYVVDFFPVQLIFFEEDGAMYYLLNSGNGKNKNYRIHSADGKFYQKINNDLLQKLIKEDAKMNKKIPILQYVINHPSFRLKKLFLKNE